MQIIIIKIKDTLSEALLFNGKILMSSNDETLFCVIPVLADNLAETLGLKVEECEYEVGTNWRWRDVIADLTANGTIVRPSTKIELVNTKLSGWTNPGLNVDLDESALTMDYNIKVTLDLKEHKVHFSACDSSKKDITSSKINGLYGTFDYSGGVPSISFGTSPKESHIHIIHRSYNNSPDIVLLKDSSYVQNTGWQTLYGNDCFMKVSFGINENNSFFSDNELTDKIRA